MCELACKVIILQCITISKHQVVCFKYIVFVCQLYIKKAGKKNKKEKKMF